MGISAKLIKDISLNREFLDVEDDGLVKLFSKH